MNWVCPIAPAHEPRIAVRRDVALLENDEREKQFVAEVVAAESDIGEARQRPDRVVRPGECAKVGLQAPDAHDDARIDAIGQARLRQPRVVRLALGAAALDARGRNGAGDVIPDRQDELGLPVGVGDDFRVEGDVRESAFERPARNPALGGRTGQSDAMNSRNE